MIPGEVMFAGGAIILNKGLSICEIEVGNKASYTIAVSSHYHFFEVNRALSFDREKAWGMRLNIPTGGWVHFEPGHRKKVELVPYAGSRVIYGNLINGACPLDSGSQKDQALKEARRRGYLDGGGPE